jgi:large subunit ribosomal protein L32e
MKPKFLRRTWKRYSKLGRGKKKKQVWRKPKGRHNKMREKRKGYPSVVKIGYKKEKKLKEEEKKKMVIVHNLRELENNKNAEKILIGNIGKKKKISIAKKAKEMKIKIHNLNLKKFLKKEDKTSTKLKEKEPITKMKGEKGK